MVAIPTMPDVFIARNILHSQGASLEQKKREKGQGYYCGISEVCLCYYRQSNLIIVVELLCAREHDIAYNSQGDKSKHTCPEQEADEVLEVSVADAVTNPGAVVVVHFHAHAALTAVKRSRRSQKLASVAIAELVVLLLRLHLEVSIFIRLQLQVFELVVVVKLLSWVGDVPVVHGVIEFWLGLVLDVVVSMSVCLLAICTGNAAVHAYAWQDARVREGNLVKHA